MEAQDATQQAFLSAFRALLGGARPRDPEAWLATIARNECRHRIRARMREPIVPAVQDGEDGGGDVHARALTQEAVAALWREVASLPAHQREAVVLRELGGRSYEEVAAQLGVSTPAVESLLFRARARLRDHLRAGLASLDLLGLAGAVARLAANEAPARIVAPAVAKGAAVTAGVVLLGGGALATERRLAHPHASLVAHDIQRPARERPSATQPDRSLPIAPRSSPFVAPVLASRAVVSLPRRVSGSGSRDHRGHSGGSRESHGGHRGAGRAVVAIASSGHGRGGGHDQGRAVAPDVRASGSASSGPGPGETQPQQPTGDSQHGSRDDSGSGADHPPSAGGSGSSSVDGGSSSGSSGSSGPG